jgi:hypothetical protein
MAEPAKHVRMTRWFDLPRLISIALRVAISTIFGQFADRRESMKAAREIDPKVFDEAYSYRKHSAGQPFWFDFVADTGDGWNPTYAVARLLAEPTLTVGKEVLPAGRILVMGGDQVYPTASRDEYQARLIAPFEAACSDANGSGPQRADSVDLYAIPGNHDWYDGLRAFLGVFCGRRIKSDWSGESDGRKYGIWQTKQTRSYFALALPHGWWLWGVDIALEGYIDSPQIEFFDHVASEWMDPQSNLIICTGQPEWAYLDGGKKVGPRFKNFSFLASRAVRAKKGHRLRLVLSGDSHHYSRYIEQQPGKDDVHYVTAGGGGAFLHPTHHLGDKDVEDEYPAPGRAGPKGDYKSLFRLKAVYPKKTTSRGLALWNVFFAIKNWGYTLTLASVCAFFAWLLNANALSFKQETLVNALQASGTFVDAFCTYLTLVFISPWPVSLVTLAVVGYVYFADFQSTPRRLVMGLLHAAAQTLIVVAATVFLAFLVPANSTWLLVILVGAAGGLLAATVMGFYLLICVLCFNRHTNEAFSSLRIEDYKNFLRIKIEPSGTLRVHPVGIDSVDSSGTQRSVPHAIEPSFTI